MHVSGLLFMVMALAAPTLALSQTTSKTVSKTPPVVASTGALAIESDVGGTLFIDGQKRSVIVVGKIAVSNLMPGQHIVELHDDKGNVLWKETVIIPRGEQIVRQIAARGKETAAAGDVADKASSFDPDLVDAAMRRLIGASAYDFATVKGVSMELNEVHRKIEQQWEIRPNLAGWSCYIHSLKSARPDRASCFASLGIEEAEDVYLRIERTLSESLRGMRFDCDNSSLGPTWGPTNLSSMEVLHWRRFSKGVYDPRVEFGLFRSLAPPWESLTSALQRRPDIEIYLEIFPGLREFHPGDLASVMREDKFRGTLFGVLERSQENFKGMVDKPLESTEAPQPAHPILDGFDSCLVSAMLKRGGVLVLRPEYVCKATTSDVLEIPSSYERQVSRFKNALSGWTIFKGKTLAPDEFKTAVEFTSFKSFEFALPFVYLVEFSNYVEVVIPGIEDWGKPPTDLPRPCQDDTNSHSETRGVSSEIDAVQQSGQYSRLPPAQAVGAKGSGKPILSIENRTAYALTILIAGPVERSVLVAPGAKETLSLPQGNYRVLGRVTAPNILPFFGTQQYSDGTSYQESFYIK